MSFTSPNEAFGPYSFVAQEGAPDDLCSFNLLRPHQQSAQRPSQQQDLSQLQWPWPFWRNDANGASGSNGVHNINTMKYSQDELDRTLARDMLGLSMEERQAALEDLHGVEQLQEENEVEIQEQLRQLEAQLQQYRRAELDRRIGGGRDTSAYALAEAMSREYVHDFKFRMMFLRATRYDPSAAADKMLAFFSMKRRLFGANKLCQPITIAHCLDDGDMESLKSGWIQLSPYKDVNGRQIIFANAARKVCRTRENAMRANFYMYMAAVEDNEDAQRRGIVWVVLDLTSTTSSSSTELRDAVPVSFRAIHLAYNDTDGKTEWRAKTKEQSVHKRVRLRIYHGSQTEVLYQLMSYGYVFLTALPVMSMPALCVLYVCLVSSRAGQESQKLVFFFRLFHRPESPVTPHP